MRKSFIFVSLFTLLFSLSCKRETFNPNKYEDLLYKKKDVPPRDKEYIFNVTIDGVKYNSTGKATVIGDEMIIKGKVGEKTLLFSISNFTNAPVFIIEHAQDSAALYTSNDQYDFASISPSAGEIKVLKLDKEFSQIEAQFQMNLFNQNGEKLSITEGYLKINYSPDNVYWDLNSGGDTVAQTVNCSFLNNTYEIIAQDTLSGKVLKLTLPKNLGTKSLNQPIRIGEISGLPSAEFIDNGKTIRIFSGTVVIFSDANNVIRGTFRDLKGGGPGTEDDATHYLTGGYSAGY